MLHPSNLRFLQTLQLLFAAQARDVLSRITLDQVAAGKAPDITHWTAAIANATRPLMLQFWQAGMVQSKLRVAALLRGPTAATADMRRHVLDTADIFGGRKGVMRNVFSVQQDPSGSVRLQQGLGNVLKAARRSQHLPSGTPHEQIGGRPFLRKGVEASITTNFDLYDPRVLDAVDAATMTFCRATNETATTDLTTAIRELRVLLKRGLKQGDAVGLLARKVREIFADPRRAFTLAATESSRAVNGGALLAAKENPAVGGKAWLASSDSCQFCQELADKGEVPLDEPFWVDPKGGPYAILNHPPLHPHCFCDMTEVLA